MSGAGSPIKDQGDGAMRKRNIAVLFRLNRREAEQLDKNVKKSGLSREAYLRHLVGGEVPREAPSADFYAMMRELHRIGNHLNQICQMARASGVIDEARYEQDMKEYRRAIRLITEAIVMPEKIQKRGI